ncbi:hypothetical protein M9Y10_025592 [Tritrichomonas musculus]|uniref:V-SNARE coiled-coil homology domain-containing protein n=1 Tax=Tritrichomonas musculus TaxID=1915356 RepID=A0ABR2H949_9EUKA
MLHLFKNVKMPSPPEEMQTTHLTSFDITIDSEIISGSFEPRFEMVALGSASGYLYIINKDQQVFRSPKSVNYPLLKLISLPNASSFFSICSKTMFKRHPSKCEKPNPYNLTMLNDIRPSKIENKCTQWIIKPDRILSRTVELNFDIVDVAISPVHPEFAMMLTAEGSLYGFSIESLNFTNLYINIFEGKPVKSICWASGYKFLVAHETVDGLDVNKLELVSQYSHKAKTVDCIDQWSTIIDEKGVPSLLMFMSCISSLDVPKGGKAIFSCMLNGPNWLSIVRTNTGDIVFENRKQKFDLNGEYAAPTCLINYENPFGRGSPKKIAISTDYGRFVYLDGKVSDHFFFNPPNVKFTLDDGEDIYVFSLKVNRKDHDPNESDSQESQSNDNNSKSNKDEEVSPLTEIANYKVYQFKNGSFYNYSKLSSLQISKNPLGISQGKIIFIENRGDIRIFDTKTQQKTELQKISPVINIRHSRIGVADLICDDGSIYRIKKNDEGFELEELEEKTPDKNLIDWRPFRDSWVGINKYKELVYGKSKKKIVETVTDRILLFDVVNYVGQIPGENEENYIVIVTVDRILVIEYDTKEKKLRKARKIKQSYITDATISKLGTLIVQTENQILMLPLPDISVGPIDKIPISKNGRAALIKKHGAVNFEPNSVSFYLDNFKTPKLYDPKTPAIEPPKINKLLKLLGKKDDTVKDADRAFQYRRTTSMRSTMNETQEITQQLLVKAAERGEQINEMEIKANRILSSAQKFHQLARELKNKHYWF